jgi:hypothetical protein
LPQEEKDMPNERSAPRRLQQQPQRDSDPQQQRAGATDFQSGAESQMEGEGNYSASRKYHNSLRDYLRRADVQADGQAAKPRSESEARELEQAEREAKAHSRGER